MLITQELETQYKLDNDSRTKSKPVELDVDDLIQIRRAKGDLKTDAVRSKTKSEPGRSQPSTSSSNISKVATKEVVKDKKLSYGSSSEDDD